MKIVHFADLHLGVETYGKSISETGLNSRLEDFLNSFDYLVDFSIENDVDLVLFCGDVYKKQNPSMTQQREFAKRIIKLTKNNIPVYLLMGNHDMTNIFGSATSAEIFDTLGIENVFVITKPSITTIQTKSGPVQIVGMPWLRKSFITQSNDYKNLTIEEINDKIAEHVTRKTQQLAMQVDTKIPCLFAGHLWTSGAQSGTESNRPTIGSDPNIIISNIALEQFDYVALGHIHRRQVLRKEKPAVVYSGSLDSLDFGDSDQEKGFMLIDIDKSQNTCDYQFIPTNGRQFIKLHYALEINDPMPMTSIINYLNKHIDDIADNIVKFTLTYNRELEKDINVEEIYKLMNEAYYFEYIPEVNIESRARVLLDDKENVLTPEKIIHKYLNENDSTYSVEHKQKLLNYGMQIINEIKDMENSDE